MTLRASSARSSAAAASSASASASDSARDHYSSALSEFAESQLDLQGASLTSNSGREGASRAASVVERNRSALTMALEHAESGDDLTPDVLRSWHAELCGGGLHPEAGTFRRGQVRAGRTIFAPHDRVPAELGGVCRGLRSLESRLIRHPSSAVPSSSSSSGGTGPGAGAGGSGPGLGLGPVALAAAAFFGVVDVHPFADGNGRLARIAANWALRRSGLPFVVNLFATTAQRAECVSAIQRTLRNTTLTRRGDADESALLEALRLAGSLGPLVDLLSDRIARAASELERAVARKAALASEQDEAGAARRFRERAASGNCIICYDDRPNVATLCCGQAVHLNCMAEWLSSRSSCPQCRGDLPSLPARMRAPPGPPQPPPSPPAEDAADGEGSGTENDTTIDDDTEDAGSAVPSEADMGGTDTTEEDASEASGGHAAAAAADTTEDHTTASVPSVASPDRRGDYGDDTTAMSDDGGSTTPSPTPCMLPRRTCPRRCLRPSASPFTAGTGRPPTAATECAAGAAWCAGSSRAGGTT